MYMYVYIQGEPKVGIQCIFNYCIPTFGPPCVYIKTLNYITNASTCFGASAPPTESFNVASAKVIKYYSLQGAQSFLRS